MFQIKFKELATWVVEIEGRVHVTYPDDVARIYTSSEWAWLAEEDVFNPDGVEAVIRHGDNLLALKRFVEEEN